MDSSKLIGKLVRNIKTHAIGTVVDINDGLVTVDFHGRLVRYSYPAAFAGTLEFEDEWQNEEMQYESTVASFASFKHDYRVSLNNEIECIKRNGGRKYRIVDGLLMSSKGGAYLYAFETDTDLHFPEGTAVKIWIHETVMPGYVVSCEDFTIFITTPEHIGDNVEAAELTSEQWQLLEALVERMDEIDPEAGSIAYQIACNGKNQIIPYETIRSGQNIAFNRGTSEQITFIWGPPGTGKTETLANIALEHMRDGKRVLMLSYSNVSVDGALLKVAKKSGFPEGTTVRYGYPRTEEILESKTLSTYQYVLNQNPQMALEYQQLVREKKKLKNIDPRKVEINREIGRIRSYLREQEEELIYQAPFVATTVSKAIVDKAVYSQKFDVVIFDEASMAYVPQIVFAAELARSHFICLGDFCQLPAIVQCREEKRLRKDIFEHTGISSAVEKGQGHRWLVMLDTQYRMHEDIAEFVSEHMYQGLIRTSAYIIESRNAIAALSPCPGKAMSLMDLSGMYSSCFKTADGSRVNVLSAFISLRLAEKIISDHEVGIITPYSAQSQFILAMIRDIRKYDERWKKVSCATVHQFQGSEKAVIIYDAVDCFRMTHPGTLLTSLKYDTANRLFNVAITRAEGKFILVANMDFFERKSISKNLMFTQAMKLMQKEGWGLEGADLEMELSSESENAPIVYFSDKQESWGMFIQDIMEAKHKIYMDVPDVIDDDEDAIDELALILREKCEDGIEVSLRVPEEVDLPQALQQFAVRHDYVVNPVTIIDGVKTWFGQPLYAADFISEGEILDTKYFPCARFVGEYTARFLKNVI